MKKNVRILMTIVIPLALIAVFAILLMLFALRIHSKQEETLQNTLTDAAQEQKIGLAMRISGRFTALEVFSDSIASAQSMSAPETLERMQRMLRTTGFEQAFFVDTAGNAVLQTAETLPKASLALAAPALEGKPSLRYLDSGADPAAAGNDKSALLLAVPVWQQGQIIGALAGTLDGVALSEQLEANGSDQYCAALCDSSGRILFGETDFQAGETGNELFEWLETAMDTPSCKAESVASGMRSGAEGAAELVDDSGRWLIAYTPLGWNGWSVCLTSPANAGALAASILDHRTYELILIAALCVLFMVLLVILLYRSAIRKSRKEREWLVNAEEEYRISARQGGLMVARFDVESGALLSSQGAIEHLQPALDKAGFAAFHTLETLAASESRESIRAFWASIRQGQANGQAEIGLLNLEGALRWYAFEFAAIGDGGGANLQAIVTIRDVNDQHARMTAYRHWQNVLLASIGKYAALMEVNLSTGVYERIEGEFLQFAEAEDDGCPAEPLLARFGEQAVEPKDRSRYGAFSSLARLRELAGQGTRKDEMEIVLLREGGKARLSLLSAQMASFPQTGELKAFITLKELEDIRFEMERLSNLALYDELSGLLNRTAARNAIEEALCFGSGERVALFMIDADNFKLVNDTLGHQHGDLALIQIAQAIKSVFRASDIVARIGGDEFFVFLSEVPGEDFAESKASALCATLHMTYSVEEHGAVALSASIGVVLAQRDKVDYETLYAEADRALYDAKKAGKNRYSIRMPHRMDAPKILQPVSTGSMLQMESLMKHLDGGVILLEVGERLEPVFISEGYFSLRGMLSDAIAKGTFPESVIHPDDFDELNRAVRACASDGEPFQISYRNILANGGYGWRHMNAARVPSLREDRALLLAVISDITELHDATEHMESIAAHAQIGIFIMRIGERLEISFFNDGALAITGFTYEQMRLFSRDASAFFRGGNLERFREEVCAANTENRMVDYLYQSSGFIGKHAHSMRLLGVRLDVQNGVPSYLVLLIENGGSAAAETEENL